jgi:hypothetical protein
MKMVLGAVVAIAFATGTFADVHAAGAKKRYKPQAAGRSSPPTADPQKSAKTFDSTLYYERLSAKIPFGTQAWWGQKELENLAP